MTTLSIRTVLSALLISVCAATLLPAHVSAATGSAASTASTAPKAADSPALFSQAIARGSLRVAVVHVTPAAAPGAKVRTEDRLDAPAVKALATALKVPSQLVELAPAEAAKALVDGRVDLALYSLPADAANWPDVTPVPTSYRTYPKAVIRSDTNIRSRADLAGRSVCVARSATQAATEATRAGATLLSFPYPSDALVAVREGKCDLGLIDQTVWQPLMHYPEWKKFSATLELADAPRTLTWLLPATQVREAQWLQSRMQQWDRAGQWVAFSKKWATDVAFDVYLDQEVPDCHS
ncbi:type 2 periplasmic-binding domain-containing protein [Advenella mimigardefordensis]|uniref:Putative ABC transporter periplasmic substrate-binding protein n=1 Tax=Advenella mimigardefordensis (strain DSM 17166 / LMG 22922 / DPN7) TaxID=1247726 RepID=W0PB73_ADVMD|nr:transporter substrate-binding domain-containing protein [Advenella mimigardefordensis]AHG62675.1 putative ABC transporter periplasmic substrate-binding protein [Advenella mimigardefordensis DPN7]